MSSEFATFWRLGVEHIADIKGYDHILFIVALTAGYGPRDWRRLLWLVTAFTLGHSLTLALATLNLVRVHGPTVELLIAVTIVVTALHSIASTRRGPGGAPGGLRLRYAMAGFFGLIHGLGFSSFLRAALGQEESIAVPLFAFNLGLEVGQIVIVSTVLLAGALVVDIGGMPRRWWVAILSTIIVVLGIVMVADRVSAVRLSP
jgi:hypothetical protein